MKYHIYRNRHVFHDDDHLGKFDPITKTVRLRPEMADHKDKVRAFFMRTKGMPVKVLVGDEALVEQEPLLEFPEEIRAQFDPAKGDLTKVAIDFARDNFTPYEFARRYAGRIAGVTMEPDTNVEEESPGEQDEQPDPEIQAIADKGPEDAAPMTRDQIKDALKARGITFKGNASTESLRAML